jgi:hypothetical protein
MNKAKQSSPLAHDGGQEAPLVAEMNNIASLAVSSGSQVAEMQNAMVELVLTECSERYRELLAAKDVPVLEQWHNFSYSGARTNLRLARACWEVATRTQGAMLGAMRECMGLSNAAILAARNTTTRASSERRMKSIVINFPERRRAA